MYVIVLNDGETWASLEKSRMLEIPSYISGPEAQDQWIKDNFCYGTALCISSNPMFNGDILIGEDDEYDDDDDYSEEDDEYDEYDRPFPEILIP